MNIQRYKKIIKRLFSQKYYLRTMALVKLAPLFSDRKYLELMFPMRVGYKLNLDNPQTYNEKLQWLKLYDRRPEYTQMVDKVEAKKYVANIIGEEHIIPTIAVYDRVEDINFETLPNQFVLKCTHDSGGIVVCKDKSKLNKKAALAKLKRGLSRNYYYQNREWPYKNVKPRIIAEHYMEDSQTKELRDYKFFCFNGKVRCFKIDFGRFIEHHANYYDRDGCLLPWGEIHCPPKPEAEVQVPDNLKDMIVCAEIISKELPFVRVDLYSLANHIYFGEITFFPASGMGQFTNVKHDYELGSWLQLSKNN